MCFNFFLVNATSMCYNYNGCVLHDKGRHEIYYYRIVTVAGQSQDRIDEVNHDT